MSIRALTPDPTGTAQSAPSFYDSAFSQTLPAYGAVESFKQGVLESFGLGTAIRESQIPDGAPIRPRPGTKGVMGESPEAFQKRRAAANPISKEQYQAGPYFREAIPFDESMTEDRAAALAEWHDAAQYRQMLLDRTPSFAIQTIAGIAGQAVDPINYIPVLGPASKAFAVGRLGIIGGRMAVASADAALNTAIAGAVTRGERASLGDDASWENLTSQIAGAAFIGAAFGGVGGVLEGRALKRQEIQLRNALKARNALNDAVGSMLTKDEVTLSTSTIDTMRESARTEADTAMRRTRRDLMSTSAISQPGPVVEPGKLAPVEGMPEALADMARQERPELFEQLDAAKVKSATHEAEVAALRATIDNRTLADAVETIDPATADRVRVIDAEMKKTIPAARRAELQTELDGIVGTLGADNLAKINSDFKIGPEKKLKQASKKLRGAQTEQGRIARQVEGTVKTILDRQRAFSDAASQVAPQPKASPQAVAAIAKVGKPAKTFKEVAEDLRIDEESGDFPEMVEYKQLEQEERVSAAEKESFEAADEMLVKGKSFGEALKAAAVCAMV